MTFKEKYLQAGQSFVEVLIVMVVVATVLTAIAAGLSFSAKNTAENQRNAVAINLAQETLEVFHRERNLLGWGSFQGAISSGTYCFDTLPSTSTEFAALTDGACGANEFVSGTNFTREATVTVSADEVAVISTVTWMDGEREREVTVNQNFQDI